MAAQAVASEKLRPTAVTPITPAAAVHAALTNLFASSRAASASACNSGFVSTLARHVSTLAAGRTGEKRSQRLVAALRMLTALLASSPPSAAVLPDGSGGGEHRGDGLASILTCLRATCEKDDGIFVEVLQLLSQCMHAEEDWAPRASQSDAPLLAEAGLGAVAHALQLAA
eukprot:CAMPEP_0115709528 /NCGR_PEP_ID=MMETSP0272-20121206/72520_1 /TAXON_ID=71861 /ORGANISM="Scrippsiella trochoidea, Strain CCMP3099" /LENGTH=170 /DNA_ID=CAMNT_0003151145 /DNA_START=26 /DNA_END=536 /DNA_ORIENTATION=-